jgi:hypothetical protein
LPLLVFDVVEPTAATHAARTTTTLVAFARVIVGQYSSVSS